MGPTRPATKPATKPPTKPPTAKLPANAVKVPDAACDAAKSGYLNSESGSVADLAAFAQSCHKSAQCNSVTFYSSGWCSHFSTTCEHKGANLGATSVIFPSGNKPTTPAAKLPANAVKVPDAACDAAKSGYLTSGSGSVADLAACAQSCHKSAQCNSVTFYSSGWC